MNATRQPAARSIEFRRRRLYPLLRTSHTISYPGDPGPVPIETVIVLAASEPGDETASVSDLPELLKGGWSNSTVGPYDIFMRIQA